VNRRSFIALIGGTAAWPLAARGQEAGRTYRLGFLTQVGRNTPGIVAFFDELRAHGFVEGRNLSMNSGWFRRCDRTHRRGCRDHGESRARGPNTAIASLGTADCGRKTASRISAPPLWTGFSAEP
jgi:hypothetical protein